MSDAPPLADPAPAAVKPEGPWPLLVLLAGAMVIGVGPILVRISDAGPTATGFWRIAFALPLLALLALRADGRPAFSAPPRMALIAGAMFALDIAFWHYGIQLTTVVNATVLSNLTPLVVIAAAWIAFGERPRPLFLAAVAVAIGGAATMALAKGGSGQQSLLGDVISTTTALWYGLYFLAVTAARRHANTGKVMLWSSLVSAPLLLVGALALGETPTPLTTAGWLACMGLGLMHVTGQGAIAWALGRLPTATTSVVVLVQPVVAGLLGWILFQEALTPLQALGGALALTGVAAAQVFGARTTAKAQAAA